MNRTPSVRTWFPDEIENTLAAVNQANGAVASAVPTPEMALYRRGYTDALAAVAVAFGVELRPSQRQFTLAQDQV